MLVLLDLTILIVFTLIITDDSDASFVNSTNEDESSMVRRVSLQPSCARAHSALRRH